MGIFIVEKLEYLMTCKQVEDNTCFFYTILKYKAGI